MISILHLDSSIGDPNRHVASLISPFQQFIDVFATFSVWLVSASYFNKSTKHMR
jgi:hypothetical protein